MKKILFYIPSLFLIFNFTACSSKTQSDIIDSNSKDISSLLQTLIEKEKEINELNQKLENCKNSKEKK